MIYYQNKLLVIEFDPSVPCAMMGYEGFVPPEEYKLSHQKFLELIRQQRVDTWLFDYKKGKVITPDDQQWTYEEWFPKVKRALGAGVKKIAIVVSTDVFNQVAVRNIFGKLPRTEVEVCYFREAAEAKTWLASQAVQVPVAQ